MVDRGRDEVEGLFVHPVEDEAVMAGNGTIGLEIAEDLADFDTVVIPWGGGGLTTGIASAINNVAVAVKLPFIGASPDRQIRARIDHRLPVSAGRTSRR